ncbi:MAG TPA: hypothetical protein VFE59_18945 [Trebonia sp.]|nr:hypothetical protein [Trebonia sp.]
MNSRNRRRNRQASMKARLGIAAAVLAGGGAAGVAVAASHSGSATVHADSAGYVLNFHHTVSEQQALTSALNMWNSNQSRSLNTLAQMAPMRTFSQFMWHRTQFAAQRGVVVAATKQFIIVKSANGKLELWWLNHWTKQKNVTASPTGMVAMTGNNVAAHTAATTGNTAPMAATMAGSAGVVNQMAAPVTKPITITINTGTQTITITITQTTASVAPTTTTTTTGMATPTTTATGMATATATPTTTATGMATATATPMATMTTMPTTTAAKTVARGDLVFVVGVRSHGKLTAELILFSVPKTAVTTTPTNTATVTTTAPATGATPVPSASPTHF